MAASTVIETCDAIAVMRRLVPPNDTTSPTIKSVWKLVPLPVIVVEDDAVAEPITRVKTGSISAEKERCGSLETSKKNDFTLRAKS